MESLNFPLQLPETELEVRKRLHQFHVDLQSVRNGTMQYPPVFSQCEMVDYCEHGIKQCQEALQKFRKAG